MFLPVGDQPNPKGVPIVNYLLLAVNIAVFVLLALPLKALRPAATNPDLYEYVQVVRQSTPEAVSARVVLEQATAYDLFVFRHGFRPASPSLADLLVSLFLHAGWLHIIGNMLFLWIYGDNVEHRLGSGLYLAAYLATGVAATLGHWALNLSSPLPTIGASGAISGVLGLYFVWFPRNQVRVFVFLFPFLMDVILLPARWVLGFYLVFDNLVPFLFGQGSSGVAHGAHLGGFFAGAALAYVYELASSSVALRAKVLKKGGRPVPLETGYDSPERPAEAGGPAASRLLDLARQGRTEEALALYASAPPEREEEALAFAEVLARRGDADAAIGVLRGRLRRFGGGAHAPAALLMIGLLYWRGKGQPASAYGYLRAALESADEGPIRDQALEALQEINDSQKFKIKGK